MHVNIRRIFHSIVTQIGKFILKKYKNSALCDNSENLNETSDVNSAIYFETMSLDFDYVPCYFFVWINIHQSYIQILNDL